MSTLTDEILRRRTFAIISHPDAGKTTLTEKLLLSGGAIQLAGEVKARGRAAAGALGLDGGRARARHLGLLGGDEPGARGARLHLLDSPGRRDFSSHSAHRDFSEGTYRFRLSNDQPFSCHNRMVFRRISAPTIGRAVRFGRSWRYLIST
jgi:peptide chain release factor 3